MGGEIHLMITKLFALIIFAFHGSTSNGGTATCDYIEVNTKLDDLGRAVFTQVIYWEFDKFLDVPVVVGYRTTEDFEKEKPILIYRNGRYYDHVLTYSRNKRIISAPTVIYTITPYDPEFQNTLLIPLRDRPLIFSGDSNVRITAPPSRRDLTPPDA